MISRIEGGEAGESGLSVVDCISLHLGNPSAAEALVDQIQRAIQECSFCAEAFELYASRARRMHPYYRIFVKNYSIFYIVIDDVMEIRRILYSRKNLSAHLRNPKSRGNAISIRGSSSSTKPA